MADPNKIFFSAGVLNHREISNAPDDYSWNMPQTIITLPDPAKVYYIYAKCSKTDSTATWEATESMLRYDSDANFYFFRIGVVYEVVDGVRGEAFDYGKTWINGRFITTGRIQSVLGEAGSYFDLDTGVLKIGSGASGLEAFDEWAAKQAEIDANSTYITAVLPAELAALQSQIDGSVDSWFYAYVPTTTNEPASLWTTPELKQAHANDTFTNTAAEGGSWRWILDGTWQWRAITDSVAVQALALASLAKDTADGKRRIFVAQPTNAMAYDIGDMWVNATYNTTYVNEMLRCVTAKVAGAIFSISHWQKASKYTDDTTATAALGNAASALAEAQSKLAIGAAAADINANTTTINGGKITTNTIVSLGKVTSFNGLHLADPSLVAGNPTDPYVFGATHVGTDPAYPLLYIGRRRSTLPNATTDGGFIVARDTLDGKYKMHVGNNLNFVNWDGDRLTIAGALLTNTKTIVSGAEVDLFEIVNGAIVFKLPLSSTGDITSWSTYGTTPTIFEALGGYVDGTTIQFTNGKLTVIGGTGGDLTNYYTKSDSNGRYSLLGHTHAISVISGLQSALDGKLATGGNAATATNAAQLNGRSDYLIYSSLNHSTPSTGNFSIGEYANRNYLQTFSEQPLDINPLGNPVYINGYAPYTTGNFNPANYFLRDGSLTMTGTLNGLNASFSEITASNDVKLNKGDGIVNTVWGNGYGGAVQILRDNATTNRWSRIGIIAANGAWVGGMKISDNLNATFDGNITAPSVQVNGFITSNNIITGAGGNSGQWNFAFAHSGRTDNPHLVTAIQLGLGNVTNESKATMFTDPVFTGSATAPIYKIKNAGGVVQWTVSVGTGERLEFKNASGVVEMVLTQSGEIHAKTEVNAYSSLI